MTARAGVVIIEKRRHRDGSISERYLRAHPALTPAEVLSRPKMEWTSSLRHAARFESVDAAREYTLQIGLNIGDVRTGRWLHAEAR